MDLFNPSQIDAASIASPKSLLVSSLELC